MKHTLLQRATALLSEPWWRGMHVGVAEQCNGDHWSITRLSLSLTARNTGTGTPVHQLAGGSIGDADTIHLSFYHSRLLHIISSIH